MGLISTTKNSASFGVDNTTVYSEDAVGRASVRIQSYSSFTKGLFVADIAHMPGDACGIWPAFWTLGSGTWPQNGEIDIIEGVNLNSKNQMTLHSGDGTCNIDGTGESGTLIAADCTTTVNGVIVDTSGCSVLSNTPNNYGDSFNSNGGGTWVMQWTDTFIKIWFFQRGTAPATLSSPHPDVTQFGTPDANFAGCDIADHFADNSIIFSTDFCGDWAANQAVYTSQCPITIPDEPAYESCVAQVANNPSDYDDGYWVVNFIKIFSETTTTSSSSSSSTTSSSSSSSSSSSTRTTTTTSSSSSSSSSSSHSSPTSSSSSSSSSAHSSSSSSSASSSSSSSSASSSASSSSSSSAGQSSSSSSSSAGHGSSSSSSASSGPVTGSSSSGKPTGPTSEHVVYTTVVTTAYTDVCPTGYTTVILTSTVTYCPESSISATIPWTTTAKPCPTGCGAGPTTVTVTVPCTESYTGKPYSSPNPEAQHSTPGYKGFGTTPQPAPTATSAAPAKVTPPYGTGNATTGKPTGAAQVTINAAARMGAGVVGVVGAVAGALWVL